MAGSSAVVRICKHSKYRIMFSQAALVLHILLITSGVASISNKDIEFHMTELQRLEKNKGLFDKFSSSNTFLIL